MDGYTNMYGFPAAFSILFENDPFAYDYFSELDESERAALINSGHDFQSKEEVERYIYHLHQDGTDATFH